MCTHNTAQSVDNMKLFSVFNLFTQVKQWAIDNAASREKSVGIVHLQ